MMDAMERDELGALLSELQAYELPVLTADSFKCGGVFLADLPLAVDQSHDIYKVLDHYVTQILPTLFDPPLVFNWAGGPDDGRQIIEYPDEDDFASDAAFEQAEHYYWEHFGEPDPWQELHYPLRAPGDNKGPRRERPASVRAFLLEQVRWTINNKLYRIPRRGGADRLLAFSTDDREQELIADQESQHQQLRVKLIDLFLSRIGQPCRFFHTNHVLEERAAQDRGWSMQRDEIFALVDRHHLRVLWALHDRHYG